MTAPDPLDDRIRELKNAARIAVELGDYVLARELLAHAIELETQLEQQKRHTVRG